MPLLWMLPQAILMELVLTGDLMAIERLDKYGFINHIEDSPDNVRARAIALAKSIASAAPLSVLAGKASILSAMNNGVDAAFTEALRLHERAYTSSDAKEGPRAFAEKRAPVWRGK